VGSSNSNDWPAVTVVVSRHHKHRSRRSLRMASERHTRLSPSSSALIADVLLPLYYLRPIEFPRPFPRLLGRNIYPKALFHVSLRLVIFGSLHLFGRYDHDSGSGQWIPVYSSDPCSKLAQVLQLLFLLPSSAGCYTDWYNAFPTARGPLERPATWTSETLHEACPLELSLPGLCQFDLHMYVYHEGLQRTGNYPD
jgi:hypothetical protein